MESTRQQTQDELLEQQHSEYIKQVTQSGMPLWYYESYYNSMYFSLPLYEYEEVNRNRIVTNIPNHTKEDNLPF